MIRNKKQKYINIIRWLLVLPSALLTAIVADGFLPYLFNILIDIGGLVRLSPLVDLLISPEGAGYHVIVAVTYFVAVWTGWHVAPSHKKVAALIVAVISGGLRFLMTIDLFRGATFTEDTPTQYLIGTFSAGIGIGLSLLIAFKNPKI